MRHDFNYCLLCDRCKRSCLRRQHDNSILERGPYELLLCKDTIISPSLPLLLSFNRTDERSTTMMRHMAGEVSVFTI